MADFDIAVTDLIINWEGGYQCDPKDRGNWTSGIIGVGHLLGTKYGVSAMAHPEIASIEDMSIDDAKKIYQKDWWVFGDIVDQAVANKVLNMAVNWQRYGGHGPAISVLQQAVNRCFGMIKVGVDGAWGPSTLEAVNQCVPGVLLQHIREMAVQRYQDIVKAHPEDAKFLAGWERRANA